MVTQAIAFVLDALFHLFILAALALLPALAILLYNEVSLRRSREAEVHALALRFGQLGALLYRLFNGAGLCAARRDARPRCACGRRLH